MKKDQLEEFTNLNKSAFDTEIPSPQIWSELDKALDNSNTTKVRKLPIAQWLAVAASVLVVLSVGVWIGRSGQTTTQLASDYKLELSDEFQSSEQYMRNVSNTMIGQLQNLNVKPEFIADQDSVEHMYINKKEELLKIPGMSEELLNQMMINHYKKKIQKLEQILERQTFFNEQHNLSKYKQDEI